MIKKSEILIKGNISASEISQLQAELSADNFEIAQLSVKSQTTQDMLELIFQDFSVVNFTRDWVLSKLLSVILKSLKKVKQALKKREKQVETFTCLFEITNRHGKSFKIVLSSKPDEFELLIKQGYKTLTMEFFDNLTNMEWIIVKLDTDKKIVIKMH